MVIRSLGSSSPLAIPAPGNNRVRPNDHLLFPSTAKEPLAHPTSLNPSGITHLLSDYPDRRFVNTLVSIATSGVRIGYEGNQYVRIRRPNHKSALIQADVISQSIQSEISKGRIKELPALPTDRYICSPLGLVPKMSDGVQTGWRVIFDLSTPRTQSVNDGIPVKYGAITYETLDDAIHLVARAGKGAVMMKRDFKSAFRHVPVNDNDHWLLIFEWEGKFFVDMFLPFGLRTAPRIFNLFSEALHWVCETLYGWNVTYYLDDFLFVFPPKTDYTAPSSIFDQTLSTIRLTKAPEKDSNGCVVTHLGFEFDSLNMEVRLPLNKKLRALAAVQHLVTARSVSVASLEEVLDFLSHCCQVVPLGRPFLRRLFSLFRRNESRYCFTRVRIPSVAKRDIRWWLYFLSAWSSISIIRLSRVNHDAATDTSGLKGIGGVFMGRVFSSQVPSRHRGKHINWKEMFAILHAFVLWHKEWAGGRVRLACDNSTVVYSIGKKSIRGDAISPLQTILLIAAVFDIELDVFWVPSEENIVADAASRHDYKKLADLSYQISRTNRSQDVKISTLRQKLVSFLRTPSHQPQGETTSQVDLHTNLSASSMATLRSPRLSSRSHTGSHQSYKKRNPQRQKVTSMPFAQPTMNVVSLLLSSTTQGSTLSSGEGNDFTEKGKRNCGSLSPRPSSAKSLTRLGMTSTELTSKQPCAWHLPDSFDLTNLRGIRPISSTFSNDLTSFSTQPTPLQLTLPSSKTDPFYGGIDKVRELLLRTGISTKGFSGHSLRKGAAVSAAANGISRDDIKLLGRWKSDAVDVYINELGHKDHIEKLLQLNSKLHSFPPPKLPSLASSAASPVNAPLSRKRHFDVSTPPHIRLACRD